MDPREHSRNHSSRRFGTGAGLRAAAGLCGAGLAVLLAAGCTGAPPAPGTATGTTSGTAPGTSQGTSTGTGTLIDESRASSAAPADFKSRRELPSCGDIVLKQGETIPQSAANCLALAATQDGAELAIAQPTTEGDYIVSFYRVTPLMNFVQVYVDATRDQFGAKEWHTGTCPTALDIVKPGGCTL
ncbi:hypothetical protein ACQCSX_13405 [Pseudarthrobacter sp. P1]|uniref:hypothetical protein n=1 Tax=Pseudarthrobacter sp. P1 TaxID=3418418 RepID=UPI003CF20F20